MGKTLDEIAKQLKECDKKIQLIYAFNGTGKTRLSRAFKELVAPKSESGNEETDLSGKRILYYNAFTEDLFYWDNDLENGINPKLKIHSNAFTNWVFLEQGQEKNTISNFQTYINNPTLAGSFPTILSNSISLSDQKAFYARLPEQKGASILFHHCFAAYPSND